jgi:hypothetical protein
MGLCCSWSVNSRLGLSGHADRIYRYQRTGHLELAYLQSKNEDIKINIKNSTELIPVLVCKLKPMRLDFKSLQRGYTVELSEDLFGAFILRRHWYGLNNRRSGVKQQVFMSESDALLEVRQVVRTRAKHGYRQQ